MTLADGARAVLALIESNRYLPPMARIAKCPDCGYEWHQTAGEVIIVSSCRASRS